MVRGYKVGDTVEKGHRMLFVVSGDVDARCRRHLPGAKLALLALLIASGGMRGLNAAQAPLSGFQALVGIGLTDEFKDENDDTFFISDRSLTPGGTWLGQGGSPHFDVALLDSGAAVSLITSTANDKFDVTGAGFGGTAQQQLGGATGFIFATVEDPLGIYATGLANRTGNSPLNLNTSTMKGQTSVSLLSLPPESDLPNVLGLSFTSQYKTSIRADQPQIFSLDGHTVRTPNVTFGTLGSGGDGIIRRAPITLNPSSSFLTPPLYVFNFENILNGDSLTQNPTNPTNIQGGLFLTVDVANNGGQVNNSQFFFDTGADVTVVSQLNAKRLGFDPVLDKPDFTMPVLGSGGTLESVPGFFVDSLTVATVGGSFTATNVPVIALDVTDPSSPGNIVPGIVGTNVFTGRNLVIDPNPSLGGGGVGPSLYISDPVTTSHGWATTSASANWQTPSSWNVPGTPSTLWSTSLTPVAGTQTALITANSTVWDMTVAGTNATPGTPTEMTVSVGPAATLTTFSGINVQPGGELLLSGGAVDTQYIESFGGTISGNGTIHAGNGPIAGQVESRGGIIAPGTGSQGVGIGQLTVDGLFNNASDGILRFDLAGKVAGTTYDQLLVTRDAKLQGTLEVRLAENFTPTKGDQFSLIMATDGLAGTFDHLSLPAAFQWNVGYEVDRLILSVLGANLAGDLNGDNAVDALDAAVMFGAWGQADALADLTHDGIVDAADAAVMFGNWTGDSLTAAVPEPTTVLLPSVLFVLAQARRRR